MKRYGLLVALLLMGCSPKEVVEKKVVFVVDPATAGSVTGTIRYAGAKVNAVVIDMEQDPECLRLYPTEARKDEAVIVNPDGTLANVFLYLKSGLEGKSFESPKTPVTMDQRGCWFLPRVVGMQTGQALRVTNSDPVTHNIHPMAQVNREWNQSQAPQDTPISRRFAKPELMIPVKCNVHKWMRAWVGVVDHPYFAVTGRDGSFELKNIPPGTYTVAAWHEKLGLKQETVTIAAGGKQSLNFSFNGE